MANNDPLRQAAFRAPQTIAAQLGQFACPETGAFTPPIHVSTTFRRDPTAADPGLVYARSDNPSFVPVERTLAALEEGEECLLFASGMAAASALIFSLQPDARVIAPKRFYAGIWEWLNTCVIPWRVRVDFLDFDDLESLERSALEEGCDLLWVETPTTPGLDVIEIESMAKLARRVAARLVVDNTSATPALTRPLARGADIVLHSATKALNGHDDVIAGALVTREADDYWERVVVARNKYGAILGSFEAWLLGRGLRTLFPRMRTSCESALWIAQALDRLRHPAVLDVCYPGLPSHPQHRLAAEQMGGQFGTLISVRLRGGEDAAKRLMSDIELWRPGTSFGGVQSMLEHRASVEADYPETPSDLVRLSVGLEDPEELLAEMVRGLDRLGPIGGASVCGHLQASLP